MEPKPVDHEVLVRAQAGDPESFATLVAPYRNGTGEQGLYPTAGRPDWTGELRPIMPNVFQASINGQQYTLRLEESDRARASFTLNSGQSHGLSFRRRAEG